MGDDLQTVEQVFLRAGEVHIGEVGSRFPKLIVL